MHQYQSCVCWFLVYTNTHTLYDIWLLCPLGLLPPGGRGFAVRGNCASLFVSFCAVPPYSHQQCGFDGADIREGRPDGFGRVLVCLLNCQLWRLHLSTPLSTLSLLRSPQVFFFFFDLSCLSANIPFLISSQFSSCFLTTSTVPIVSFEIIRHFHTTCLLCSFAPHTAGWPAACYFFFFFFLGGRRATTAWGRFMFYFKLLLAFLSLSCFFLFVVFV